MEEGERACLRDLMRARVRDVEGREIGHLHDLSLEAALEKRAVTGVCVRLEWTDRVGSIELARKVEDIVVLVPWSSVAVAGDEEMVLRDAHPRLSVESAGGRRLLRRDVLDKQMVDSRGGRLQRVDDVVLRWRGDGLFVEGLEVSGGIMASARVKKFVSRLRSHHEDRGGADFIPWSAVERVEEREVVLGDA